MCAVGNWAYCIIIKPLHKHRKGGEMRVL